MHGDQYVLARVHGERLAKALQARRPESARVFPREERAYFDIFSCRFFDRSFVVPRLLAQFPGGSVQEALVARGSRYRYLRTERADEHAKSRTWLPQR